MHKRQVIISLLLIIAAVIASAVLANIDPFNTQSVWTNWTVLSIFGTVGIIIALIGTINWVDDDEIEHLKKFGGIAAVVLIVPAMFIGMFSSPGGISPKYVSLTWGSYALMLGSYVLNGLIGYLIRPQELEEASITQLRRPA